MQKVKEVFSKLWNGYKDWLGDVIWYRNWKFWLSVVIVLAIGLSGDSEEPEAEVEIEEPKIEEIAEKDDVEPEEKIIEEEPEEPEEIEVVEPEDELEPEPSEVQFDPNDYNAELTYDDLARNPDEHAFKAITFEGKIIQVMQSDDYSQYRIATNDNYDKVMLLEIDNSQLDSRILEDDYIRFWGTYMGEITYESTLGGNITIPGVVVDKFEFQ